MLLSLNVRKNKVGKEVFESFEKKINRRVFTAENDKKNLEVAASIVEENPFVTMPLRNNGIVSDAKGAGLLHVFQPNLWAQDYAYTKNSLSKMTAGTAIERANASAEYKLERSRSLHQFIRRNGRKDEDFLDSMQKAALIESAYYHRISGDKMEEKIERKIDSALMRRALKNESMLTTIAKNLKIDLSDPLAVYQVSQTLDLTECLQDFSKDDPYFARRFAQFESFKEINSEKSVALATLKNDDFALEVATRLLKKKGADIWLIKAVESALKPSEPTLLV